MRLFRRKKEKKEKEKEELEFAGLEEILYAHGFAREPISEKLPRTLYEKLCFICERILPVDPDEKTKARMERAIEIAHLNITPRGAASLTLLSCGILSSLAFLLIVSKLLFGVGLTLGHGLLLITLAVPLAYYLYTYPMRLQRVFISRIGGDITMMILYMVIYLRDSPNLEGAISFAARNLTGPLAKDLKKLLWDLEIGRYFSVDDALMAYLSRWSCERYFVEAFQLMRTAIKQPTEKRLRMLDEVINVILRGSKERAKGFVHEMRMPVMLVHALGILLPVMGLVMFPIVGIFLAVKGEILFIGYDILLPIALYFFINHVLETRPPTFARIQIREHPLMPRKGRFRLGKKLELPCFWFTLLVSSPLIALASYLFLTAGRDNFFQSIFLTVAIAFAVFLYNYLSSFQRVKIRNEIQEIEQEFAEALFQLGHQTSTGTPIEVAIERATQSIGDLTIKKFYERILHNMRTFGMSFKEAIFNEKTGAILYYPSNLIRNVMRIVADAAKRGAEAASITMLAIARYLKNLSEMQSAILDMLGDVITSLRFQAYVLTPFVSGVIVTMGVVMIGLISRLMAAIQKIKLKGQAGQAGLPLLPWAKLGITTGEFQLICGIYFIETSLIIAAFISSIMYGEDEIGKRDLAAKILVFGGVIYLVSLLISYFIFYPMTVGMLK